LELQLTCDEFSHMTVQRVNLDLQIFPKDFQRNFTPIKVVIYL